MSLMSSSASTVSVTVDAQLNESVIKKFGLFVGLPAQDIKRETRVLTDEGKKYAAEGSSEIQLFLAVPAECSILKDELQKKPDSALFEIGCSQSDKFKDLLVRVQDGRAISKEDINGGLKARKLIVIQMCKGYSVSNALKKEEKTLQKGDWKELEFKEYNFNAKAQPADPLLKFYILSCAGCSFEEMPTNNFVESSFWNFDALFQPQEERPRMKKPKNQ
ncbi:hypothetical protein CUMW_261910 [Citrus unshiu]|uniref:Uncharacterized protein n=1 Tax=Citrus unshiu TaxID=55188 RepID=A0A2H5QV33_CITUN|nr:hypothetical protein CUMW_261910 [Citrus unshiu]